MCDYYVYDTPWEPRTNREDWPVRREKTFILAAFSNILDAMWGLEWEDMVLDPHTGGYRGVTTGVFEDVLMRGGLLAWLQPVGGGAFTMVGPNEWTRDGVRRVLESGKVERTLNRRVKDHWVFLSPAEVDLLARIVSATDLTLGDDEREPIDRLCHTMLENISRIARPDDGKEEIDRADEMLRLFLPSMKLEFREHADKERFVEACAPWLIRRFEKHPGRHLDKAFFWRQAQDTFGNRLLSRRTFDLVWARATATSDDFEHHATGGRKPGEA